MNGAALVVDDNDFNREILTEMLETDFEVYEATNGIEAIKQLELHQSELVVVLLDLMMPVLDGFGVLNWMNEQKTISKIPVLIISGEQSMEVERQCFDLGVSDFVRKPFDGILVQRRAQNAANLFIYSTQLEKKVEEQTAELRDQYIRMQETNDGIIEMLGNAVEVRSEESGVHIKRVKGFTRVLAEEIRKNYPEYNLTRKQIDLIVTASALHDVGKIGIPDSILLKPGRLTPDEFAIMKQHTVKGCEIIQNAPRVWNAEFGEICYDICRHHHEKYDGRGYPDGLKGDEISIAAQIVSVADVYDALVTERVYKKPFPKDVAFQMILDGQCGAFSDKLMDCFRKVRLVFEAMVDTGGIIPEGVLDEE